MGYKRVDDVEIDMEMQKVTVNGNVEHKKVLKAVRRTGRRAVLWPCPYGDGAAAAVRGLAQQHYHPGGGELSHASHVAHPTSSYNYYKHGYDDLRMYGAYYHHGANSAVVGTRATEYFSDENTQGCTVM